MFGSPWIPICGSWGFMYSRDSERAEQLWRDIPEDVDVLLTHTPARFVGDSMNAPGCDALRRRIEKTRPRLHIFGHVHQAYGVTRIIWEEMNTRSTGTVGRSEVVEDTGEKKKVWRVQANGKKGKDTLCVNAAMKGLGKKSIVVGLEEAAEEDLKNWRVKARKISGGLMFNSSES